MVWERRRWRWAVGSAGAYEYIRPKLTTAQIHFRRPKTAATVLLKLLYPTLICPSCTPAFNRTDELV